MPAAEDLTLLEDEFTVLVKIPLIYLVLVSKHAFVAHVPSCM
jgi:hypothetical protein